MNPGGSFDPQGPVAEAMADLWWLMLALGVAAFVVFAVLLGIGLFRRPSDGTDDADDADASGRTGRWLVGWGVIGPLVIIAVVFGATIQAMRVMADEAPPDALVVDVVGHRWWYEVTYADHDVTTTNELHIPVGRTVALRLTSADVIHSFWVPELGGKMDMLPDGVNTLVLRADEPGEHISRCAEFCGLEHTTMQLTVVAEPAEQFDAWVADQQTTAAAPIGDGQHQDPVARLEAGR